MLSLGLLILSVSKVPNYQARLDDCPCHYCRFGHQSAPSPCEHFAFAVSTDIAFAFSSRHWHLAPSITAGLWHLPRRPILCVSTLYWYRCGLSCWRCRLLPPLNVQDCCTPPVKLSRPRCISFAESGGIEIPSLCSDSHPRIAVHLRLAEEKRLSSATATMVCSSALVAAFFALTIFSVMERRAASFSAAHVSLTAFFPYSDHNE